jgi:hypothetical protein
MNRKILVRYSLAGKFEILSLRRITHHMHASERKKDSTNEEPAPEEDAQSPSKSSDGAAAEKAEEASEAKAEELRTALQSKSEQGKSSLGSLPADED